MTSGGIPDCPADPNKADSQVGEKALILDCYSRIHKMLRDLIQTGEGVNTEAVFGQKTSQGCSVSVFENDTSFRWFINSGG